MFSTDRRGHLKPRKMSRELRGSLKELPSGRTKPRVTDVRETNLWQIVS